jgi:aminoglycoside 6'-N-acetyltransferase I
MTGGIRLITAGDRDEWLRMLALLYAAVPASDHVPVVDAYLAGAEHVEKLPSAVFVAEREGGGLSGFLELSVRDYAEGCTGRVPYIESWYVDEDLRGRDVGRALMQAAESWSRARGYVELASDAELDNVASHDAHRALGFDEVERTVHFRKALGVGTLERGAPPRDEA